MGGCHGGCFAPYVPPGLSRATHSFDADSVGVAQFFKGVATVCTKLFNAVEVSPSLPHPSIWSRRCSS